MTQGPVGTPPATRTVDTVDDWFGTAVPDPYRWLEDSDGAEAQAWLAAQGAVTRRALDALPHRDAVTARLDALSRLPRRGLPHEAGGHWFRQDHDGTEQDVLVVADTATGAGRVLLDPTPLSAGATTSLAGATASPDGTLVAYAWSEAGSDWRTWRVREVATGTDLPDEVPWAKFTEAVWLPDGSGFVYGAYDAPESAAYVAANSAQTLRVHRIGTDAADDRVLLERPGEPDVVFDAYAVAHHRYLVVLGRRGTEWAGRVWVREGVDGELRPLVEHEDASWEPVGAIGGELLFVTDLDAPFGRLVALDPATAAVREVVATRSDALQDAVRCGDRLVLHWLADAASRLTVHQLDGTQRAEVELPGRGTVLGLSADDDAVYASFTSFTRPPSLLSIDVHTVVAAVSFTPTGAPDPERFVTDQVWVTSRDGVRLPVFLAHRRDVTVDGGPHPAVLYGYGGFRIPVTPTFNLGRYAVVEAGGVLAVPSLRGGGEYGAAWHDAGRLADKQNVFDDAVAAAEWLIDAGWTDAAHLAATGGSNGGLLAGALVTQRPELFAAVIPEVGVLDMLRFTEFTIGSGWTPDYGDPRRSVEEFRTLHAYSPYHRVRGAERYPPLLIMTSDHDDRVVPAHSMKFAARVQASGAPTALLRVEPASGHGAGRARSAVVRERADVLLFLARYTGLEVTRLG